MNQTVQKLKIDDTDELTRAIGREVRKAIRRHKLLGNPIAVAGENGGVVIIQPEDIIIEDEE